MFVLWESQRRGKREKYEIDNWEGKEKHEIFIFKSELKNDFKI